MSILKTGLSAIGKLAAIALLAATFFAGMIGVLYFALRSPEVKVPSIVGKDMPAGEQELAALGLKIHKRADRYSEEKPNTILEQTPIAGEMVKGGQTISIVISRAEAEGAEKPAELKKESVDDKKDDKKDSTLTPKKKVNQNTNLNKNTSSNKSGTKSNKNANSSDSGNSNSDSNNNSSNDNSSSKNDNSSGANKPGSSSANTGTKPNTGAANTSVKPTPPKNPNPTPKPATPTTTSNKPATSGANRRPNP